MTGTEMSSRLSDIILRAQMRNYRAFCKHEDARHMRQFDTGMLRDESAYERFVRDHIEGGICWRDQAARRLV